MTSLADVVIEDTNANPGNSDNALKMLREAIQENASANTDTKRNATNTDADTDLPEKFRGKSAKEIAESYLNLESRLGTMANDLGVQRQLTDRLLDLKRSGDLSRNDPTVRKPTQVRTEELLDKPTETLDRVIETRVREIGQEVDQKINSLRMTMAEASFKGKHSDFQSVVTSPDFTAWVNASPIRLRAAATANQGDWQVATELLDEFKASKKQVSRKVDDGDDVGNIESARRASLDSSSGSGGSGAVDGTTRGKGKIYSRADLMKLRINDPEAYYDDSFQGEILKAYSEGRVR
jgi:hypothetical protein